MLIIIVFVISLIVSTIIVNGAYQLFMRVMGASGMFFSAKKKIIAILVIALLLAAIVIRITGIQIPGS